MNDGHADPTPDKRRTDKSATAFRTISEVATELELPQHVLRFWESKFSQIRPMKRGGGRRYYRPEDVDLLRRIRGLLYDDGYTIKGVQKLLRTESGRGGAKAASNGSGGAATETPGKADQPTGQSRGQSRGQSGGQSGGLSDEERAELKAILSELEEIRSLL